MPLFLAALTRSEGGWAIAHAQNACPTAFAGAKRYAWSVGVGEQMTIADRPSQPGRYCYALWSTDPLGRPSDRPATAWVTALETPAATARPLGGHRVRLRLEPVGQRLELRRLSTRRVRQSLRQQPVREPGIAGEQRAVEVGADRAADPDALVARLAVVPEPGEDAAERLRARDRVAFGRRGSRNPRRSGARRARARTRAGRRRSSAARLQRCRAGRGPRRGATRPAGRR